MYQGITTVELDNLTAETAAYLTTTHPDYAILAARIAVSNLHKETDQEFSAVIDKLYNYMHPIQKCQVPLVSKDLYDVVMDNADRVNKAIDYERDYDYNFFGFKTLEKSYLMRCNGKSTYRWPVPPLVFFSLFSYWPCIQGRSSSVRSTCSCVSLLVSMVTMLMPLSRPMTSCPSAISHMLAQPCSMPVPQNHKCQVASWFRWRMIGNCLCYTTYQLSTCPSDEIDHSPIYIVLKESTIRWLPVLASPSLLEVSVSVSKRSVPLALTLPAPTVHQTELYLCSAYSTTPLVLLTKAAAREMEVSQCKTKLFTTMFPLTGANQDFRYTEPWHSDIFDFLDLRKNSGKEELRARDLFLGLWIPDLFMKSMRSCILFIYHGLRNWTHLFTGVKANADWSLFCPNEAPRLNETYGKEFEELYEKYEQQGKARRVISAQKLWFSILDSQIETGMPYILYKGKLHLSVMRKHTVDSSSTCTL